MAPKYSYAWAQTMRWQLMNWSSDKLFNTNFRVRKEETLKVQRNLKKIKIRVKNLPLHLNLTINAHFYKLYME